VSLSWERSTAELVFYTWVARSRSESSSFTASALNTLSSSSSSSSSSSRSRCRACYELQSGKEKELFHLARPPLVRAPALLLSSLRAEVSRRCRGAGDSGKNGSGKNGRCCHRSRSPFSRFWGVLLDLFW